MDVTNANTIRDNVKISELIVMLGKLDQNSPIRIAEDDYGWLLIDMNGDKNSFKNLCKKNFEIADRVYHKKFGFGTIFDFESNNLRDGIVVVFDNSSEDLHAAAGRENNNPRLPDNRCWFCTQSEIEHV